MRALEKFVVRLKSFFCATDLREGDLLPAKWFAHGRIIPRASRLPMGSYYMLRLPVYSYRVWPVTMEPRWHQFVYWVARSPSPCEYLTERAMFLPCDA